MERAKEFLERLKANNTPEENHLLRLFIDGLQTKDLEESWSTTHSRDSGESWRNVLISKVRALQDQYLATISIDVNLRD